MGVFFNAEVVFGLGPNFLFKFIAVSSVSQFVRLLYNNEYDTPFFLDGFSHF